MLKRPRKYVWMVVKSWGKSISGPVIGGIGLILIAVQLGVEGAPRISAILRWGEWTTLYVAGLFVLVAQYDVWREEQEGRAKAEDALNAAADIRGDIWVQLSKVNPFADQTNPGSALGYTCDCSNHGRVTCQINKVRINVKPPKGLAFNLMQDLAIPEEVEHGRAFKYQSDCAVHGISPEGLRVCTIDIRLIDSLGREYPNTVTRMSPLVMKVIPHEPARPASLFA
jgi:hypothetical protein